MKHPLTQRSFRDWLKGRPADEVIGKAVDAFDCPCQRCIRDTGKLPFGSIVAVSTSSTTVYKNGAVGTRNFVNPEWLRRLIQSIDQSHDISQPVTAGTVRRLFRKATHPA